MYKAYIWSQLCWICWVLSRRKYCKRSHTCTHTYNLTLWVMYPVIPFTGHLKASKALKRGVHHRTPLATDSKTQNATGNGLLAFLNSKGASVSSTLFTSSKRSHNSTVLPKLKRQRRDSTTDKPSHKQQSRTRRQKSHPQWKQLLNITQ